MSKTLQDVKAGDIVVKRASYSPDWERSTVSSVTPTRIRAFHGEWNKADGRLRGADTWARTSTIYPDDHPDYVQWLADNAALAEKLTPLLHKLSAKSLRELAAKLGVK